MSKTIHLSGGTNYGISNATAGYLWAKGMITPHADALAITLADVKTPMPETFVIDPTAVWSSAMVEVLMGGVPTDPSA